MLPLQSGVLQKAQLQAACQMCSQLLICEPHLLTASNNRARSPTRLLLQPCLGTQTCAILYPMLASAAHSPCPLPFGPGEDCAGDAAAWTQCTLWVAAFDLK